MSLEEKILKRERELAYKWVGVALDILSKYLLPFVEERYRATYGNRFKEKMAEVLRQDGEQEARTDAARALDLLLYRWKELGLDDVLGPKARSYMYELKEDRNRWAHQEAFAAWEARRTLETTALLLRSLASKEGLRDLLPYLEEALAEESFGGLLQSLHEHLASNHTFSHRSGIYRTELLLRELYEKIVEAEQIDRELVQTVLRAYKELPPAGQSLLLAALRLFDQDTPGYEVCSCLLIKDGAGLADLISDALAGRVPATEEGIGWLLYAGEIFSGGMAMFNTLKNYGWDFKALWPYRSLVKTRV